MINTLRNTFHETLWAEGATCIAAIRYIINVFSIHIRNHCDAFYRSIAKAPTKVTSCQPRSPTQSRERKLKDSVEVVKQNKKKTNRSCGTRLEARTIWHWHTLSRISTVFAVRGFWTFCCHKFECCPRQGWIFAKQTVTGARGNSIFLLSSFINCFRLL